MPAKQMGKIVNGAESAKLGGLGKLRGKSDSASDRIRAIQEGLKERPSSLPNSKGPSKPTPLPNVDPRKPQMLQLMPKRTDGKKMFREITPAPKKKWSPEQRAQMDAIKSFLKR